VCADMGKDSIPRQLLTNLRPLFDKVPVYLHCSARREHDREWGRHFHEPFDITVAITAYNIPHRLLYKSLMNTGLYLSPYDPRR
jgi:hypothetical protein